MASALILATADGRSSMRSGCEAVEVWKRRVMASALIPRDGRRPLEHAFGLRGGGSLESGA